MEDSVSKRLVIVDWITRHLDINNSILCLCVCCGRLAGLPLILPGNYLLRPVVLPKHKHEVLTQGRLAQQLVSQGGKKGESAKLEPARIPALVSIAHARIFYERRVSIE